MEGSPRLIAAFLALMPSHPLVPRVSAHFWLAPMRTLATLASGAALFLFVASAVMSALPFGTGGGAAAPAFAPVSNASRERPAGPAGAAGPTGAGGQRTRLNASASPPAGFAVN